MTSRRFGLFLSLLILLALGGGGMSLAQLESGERGIPPIDSASTLEIGGIRVDVAGKDAETARLAGWRLAQRRGFAKLWAQIHKQPEAQAPKVPDSTLDGIVSSIAIEDEQIAPGRYLANLTILFDRSRSAALLGASGPVRRSAPLLLIPVMISGGTATTVELRNPWQRAWAEYRTANSAIDYVRISGQGIDPLLVTAAQVRRPGRAMWRNLVDFYGAADVLVATAHVRRLYPGGPTVATFSGSFGPDQELLGSFTLRAESSADLPRMMAEGVRQMDALYTRWLAAGALQPDPSLLPPPPPPVVEEEEEEEESREQVIQIAVTSPYSPVGWLRSIPGVASVQEIGSQVLVVRYRGSAGQLAGALNARGWQTSNASGVFTITGYAPPRPAAPPAQPAPAPQPAPAEPLVPTATNREEQ
ncbi:heavy-metal-associated domain-containing protein [Sphingomonas sp. LHG3406-1]|uniref:heavy-metal-associated domain-containing protein n=1 Tax=Sphingomonas sp. LHG3406-1 TaxID=2804617 RepID=UPI002635C13C|nr:heavy-metal-associated domain-containing protein [Sphingomonas sp. LHG3406-1]